MESLAPIRALAKVDLPTLGRPTMATNPQRKGVLIYDPDSKPRANATGCHACAAVYRPQTLRSRRAAPAPVGLPIARLRVDWSRLPAHGCRGGAHRMPPRIVDYVPHRAWPQPYKGEGPGALPGAVPEEVFWRPCPG